MEMTVLWDIAPCSLLEVDGRFRGASIYETFEVTIKKSETYNCVTKKRWSFDS